jgi:hypothetical protein
LRKPIAVHAVVRFESPDVEPVTAELRRQPANARVALHPPRLDQEDLGIVQVAGRGAF